MQVEPADVSVIERMIADDALRVAHIGVLRDAAVRWVKFVATVAVVAMLLTILTEWSLAPLTTLTPARAAAKLLPLVVTATALAYIEGRRRHTDHRDPTAAAQRVLREWRELTEHGWWKRVSRNGALLTAGVGFPIGALLAVSTASSELPRGGRLALAAYFVLATGAWAFPLAFLTRLIWLRSLQKYMKGKGATGPNT